MREKKGNRKKKKAGKRDRPGSLEWDSIKWIQICSVGSPVPINQTVVLNLLTRFLFWVHLVQILFTILPVSSRTAPG